jgi:hypothetical protein
MLGDDMRYNTSDWYIYAIGTSDRYYFDCPSASAPRKYYRGSTKRLCVADLSVSWDCDGTHGAAGAGHTAAAGDGSTYRCAGVYLA